MSLLSTLVGTSTVIRHVQHLVVKVAESDLPVLITGESGTGKEEIARSIHEKSARNDGPFIVAHCTTSKQAEMESELFGYTDINGTYIRGLIESATSGTLFIKEVNNLTLDLQQKLLNYINDTQVQKPEDTKQASARIICTSNLNMDLAVRDRKFREDLYYRLSACSLYIPPLRERKEDIPALVDHFLQKYSEIKMKNIIGISPDALGALLQHSWNHNIRELENLIERIVILKSSGSVEISDLPPRLRTLVTNDINGFYEVAAVTPPRMNANHTGNQRSPTLMNNRSLNSNSPGSRSHPGHPGHFPPIKTSSFGTSPSTYSSSNAFEESSEIDQFIKKDIDLGNGIDFYRVVEEFENKLIAEALRRTNHNKNRAAQLLSMNRTTLVEKLKKRAVSSSVKVETGRIKRNPAFTIFDGLGQQNRDFEILDFIPQNEETAD